MLLFKITAFYFNIFQNVIYSCDFKAEFIYYYFYYYYVENIFSFL